MCLCIYFSFEAAAKLGEKEICKERGPSKHEARIRAAEKALQMLSLQVSGRKFMFEDVLINESYSCTFHSFI